MTQSNQPFTGHKPYTFFQDSEIEDWFKKNHTLSYLKFKSKIEPLKERIYRCDCLVTGYQDLIPSLSLPDKDDRHVLAAAIYASASIIVTFNLKDFPATNLNEYGVEAQHPDNFIVNLIEMYYESVCDAVKQHRLSLKNLPKSIDESFATYEKQGLFQTVTKLKLYNELL